MQEKQHLDTTKTGEQDIAFAKWFAEAKRIASLLGWTKAAIDSMDREGWRTGYFDEGYTPAEAWKEEYDSAR